MSEVGLGTGPGDTTAAASGNGNANGGTAAADSAALNADSDLVRATDGRRGAAAGVGSGLSTTNALMNNARTVAIITAAAARNAAARPKTTRS